MSNYNGSRSLVASPSKPASSVVRLAAGGNGEISRLPEIGCKDTKRLENKD
jgi:hypothetical protein